MADKIKEGTRILKCTCEHEFQDKAYGKGMRVHNVTEEGDAACTVCTPNYRINRMNSVTATDANKMLGQVFIPARKPRNLKKVAA